MRILKKEGFKKIEWELSSSPEQEKMRGQLVAQFMPFILLIAHILTLRHKKVPYISVSGPLWLSLARSLALSGSLRLSLQVC